MGFVLAAAIATVLALVTIGAAAWCAAPRADRRMLALAFFIALPLQPLVFYLLRLPLDAALRAGIGIGLGKASAVIGLGYAPLTEEPAKWLALAMPCIRMSLTPYNAVPLALMLGLGFGVGEIWFLTHAIASLPGSPDLPFWLYWGFVLERLEVCLLHGVFVAFPVVRLAQGQSFWPGACAAIVLHFLTNFPIYPAQLDAFGLGAAAWKIALMVWIAGLTIAGAVTLRHLHRHLTRLPAPA
jgi:hypothetical protein